MTTILVILLVTAWIYKMYRDVKKQVSVPEGTEEVSSQGQRPAFESLFDEHSEVPFAEEESKAGLFSYETVDDNVVTETTGRGVQLQEFNSVADGNTEDPMSFDLRQAVIYQTILQNPYVLGTSQYRN